MKPNQMLIVTRGIPASGKTTWARRWVAESPEARARINRDDLRRTMYGLDAPLPYELERAISTAQREAVRGLLETGRSVIVDDTNIRSRYIRGWRELAMDSGASFTVRQFDVPVEECVRRDRARHGEGERSVGAEAVRMMSARYANALREEDRSQPVQNGYRYEPDDSLPSAYIFDIDGTLARSAGRSPYDYSRVSEDEPVRAVIELARELHEARHDIVIVSGRESACRTDTERWLAERAAFVPAALLMRASGDRRDDATIKLEIFRERIAPYWNVRGVFDDRNRVVRMWRSIGLLCCQVAPGAF